MHDNTTSQTATILCFGDLVGNPGVALFAKHAPLLRAQHGADAIIVNGENTCFNGRGTTPEAVERLRAAGANVITGGNHSFQRREFYAVLTESRDVLRPCNFPAACPGTGVTVVSCGSLQLGVVCVQARTFMREQVGCPFRAVESALPFLHARTKVVVVEFHGEASSEKSALAYYVDGKVSAVLGTHTHIQTADERVLPAGTAFITDLGASCALNSAIGMKKDPIIYSSLTQLPSKFEVEETGPFVICGVVLRIDVATGRAQSIERFRIIDESVGF
jgi:metallophosphoesterase (TIGR00282 family)